MVTVRALTPVTRLSLGELLPHQQADRTRAPLEAPELYRITLYENSNHRILFPLSKGYFRLQGRLPTRYSPVCHLPKKKIINRSFRNSKGSFDLHTLGTQPTLILSYDQTLIEKRFLYCFNAYKGYLENIQILTDLTLTNQRYNWILIANELYRTFKKKELHENQKCF